jgi:hypothetical protein
MIVDWKKTTKMNKKIKYLCKYIGSVFANKRGMVLKSHAPLDLETHLSKSADRPC